MSGGEGAGGALVRGHSTGFANRGGSPPGGIYYHGQLVEEAGRCGGCGRRLVRLAGAGVAMPVRCRGCGWIKKDALGFGAPLPGVALQKEMEPYGACRGCGAPLYPTGRRGRPPVRCLSCRGVC